MKAGENRLAWPYGAFLTFTVDVDRFREPVELIISGAMLTPWFRFGVDTDEDWERIRKYPGLVACFETGNIFMIMPAYDVRNSKSPSLAMRFFRSCGQIMESVRSKTNNMNQHLRPNGRERVPNYWYFDIYVVNDVTAMAFVGLNYVMCPLMWASSCGDGESLIRSGAWGLLHEMGHHHQESWGLGERRAYVEVTNNVLILICYSYYSLISETRYEKPNGGIGYPGGDGQETINTHPYSCMFRKGSLEQYSSLIHGFGPDKMREFIRSEVQNLYYDKNKGNFVAYVIRGAHVLGYDLRPHMKFMGYNLDNEANAADLAEVDKLGVKPWYPIANIYQTGYEINGKTFESCRPWVIKFGESKIFNFKEYSKSRPGHGTFTIGELKGGRGKWEPLEEGVYRYTPPSDRPYEPDEWRLTYHESETSQDVITYGRIRQDLSGNVFHRYHNVRSSSGTYTPVEAYRATKNRTPDIIGYGNGISLSKFSQNYYVSVCRGTFVAPRSGSYTFYAECDDAALFYLSESLLSFDPDLDSERLILDDNNGFHKYDKKYGSKACDLTAGKAYSFCFVIYNHLGDGSGKIGYIVDGTGDMIEVASNDVLMPGANPEDARKCEFAPEWEELSGLHDYYKEKTLSPEIVSITGPAPQKESDPVTNLVNKNTNDVFISKWQPGSEAVPFPHVYEMTFGSETQVKTIKLNNLTKSGFTKYYVIGSIDIECDDSVVYSGAYDSREQKHNTITLPNPVSCRSLKVKVKDNSDIWSPKNNEKGGSAFSEITCGVPFDSNSVIPVSHSSFHFDSKWINISAGSYYDGLGKRGSSGGSLTASYGKGTSELVIIGDKWFNGDNSQVNRASVYVNNKLVGEFTANLVKKPQFGSTLYKTPLFVLKDIDPETQTNLKIVVESGEIVISGVVVKSSEKANALNPDLTAAESSRLQNSLPVPHGNAANASSQLHKPTASNGTILSLTLGTLLTLAVAGGAFLVRRHTPIH